MLTVVVAVTDDTAACDKSDDFPVTINGQEMLQSVADQHAEASNVQNKMQFRVLLLSATNYSEKPLFIQQWMQ